MLFLYCVFQRGRVMAALMAAEHVLHISHKRSDEGDNGEVER
jgi:hypothetical protein